MPPSVTNDEADLPKTAALVNIARRLIWRLPREEGLSQRLRTFTPRLDRRGKRLGAAEQRRCATAMS
jgi:hypothetical protein